MKSKDELTKIVDLIEKWSVKLGLNNSTPLHQTLKYYDKVFSL
jgi:hypothetical protein